MKKILILLVLVFIISGCDFFSKSGRIDAQYPDYSNNLLTDNLNSSDFVKISDLLIDFYELYEEQMFADLNKYISEDIDIYVSLKNPSVQDIISDAEKYFIDKKHIIYKPHLTQMQIRKDEDIITAKLGLHMSWNRSEPLEKFEGANRYFYKDVNVIVTIKFNSDLRIISYTEDIVRPKYKVIKPIEYYAKSLDLDNPPQESNKFKIGTIVEDNFITSTHDTPFSFWNYSSRQVLYEGTAYWLTESTYYEGSGNSEYYLVKLDTGLDENTKVFFPANENIGLHWINFELPIDYDMLSYGPNSVFNMIHDNEQVSGTQPPIIDEILLYKNGQYKYTLTVYDLSYDPGKCFWQWQNSSEVLDVGQFEIDEYSFLKQEAQSDLDQQKFVNYCFANRDHAMIGLTYYYQQDSLDQDLQELDNIIQSIDIPEYSGHFVGEGTGHFERYHYYISNDKLYREDKYKNNRLEELHQFEHDYSYINPEIRFFRDDLVFNRFVPIQFATSTEGYYYCYFDIKNNKMILERPAQARPYHLVKVKDNKLYYLEAAGLSFSSYIYHCGMELGSCADLFSELKVKDLSSGKEDVLYEAKTGILKLSEVTDNQIILEETEIVMSKYQQWINDEDKPAMYLGSYNVQIKFDGQVDSDKQFLNVQDYENQAKQELTDWFAKWSQDYPNFSFNDLELTGYSSFVCDYEHKFDNINEFSQEILDILPVSPDQRKVLSVEQGYVLVEKDGMLIREHYGLGPDSSAGIISLDNQKYQRLLQCGTACTYSDGFWINNDLLIVAGSSEDFYKTERTGQYYITPTLFLFDFKNNRLYSYEAKESVLFK